jgi:hypothetical protein
MSKQVKLYLCGFNSETSITLKDINTLETVLKGYSFNITTHCEREDTEYSNVSFLVRFSKLTEEEDKEK